MSSSEDSDSNSSSRNVSEAGESENEGDFGVVGGLGAIPFNIHTPPIDDISYFMTPQKQFL